MTKIPREEISYEKIYKNLDLDKKYKIVGLKDEMISLTDDKNGGVCKVNLEKDHNIKDVQYCLDDINLKKIEKDDQCCVNDVKTEDNTFRKEIQYCLDDFDLKFIENMKTKLQIELDDFEFIIDRLEKEWHNNLQSLINEKFEKLEPQDFCDICTFKENEENLIIVCQGCGISVHRDCYGSSYDKEEVFLCLRCIYHHKDPICMFCDFKGGMMKMTTDCRWGHITCVLFDGTLDFDNPNSREPIDISKYTENNGICCFCNKNVGTKVQCSYGLCPKLYHVSCGLDKTYFDMENLVSYCTEHNPLKSKSVFSNNHSFFKHVVGYKKLDFPPSIRKQLSLSEYKETIIQEILNTQPFVLDSIFRELLEEFKDKKKILEAVCSFWKLKKKRNNSPFIPFLRLKFDSL